MNIDIAQQLRSHIDEAAPPVTIDEAMRRVGAPATFGDDQVGRQRRGRSLVITAAFASMVVATAVAALVGIRSSWPLSVSAAGDRVEAGAEGTGWELVPDLNAAFDVSDLIGRESSNGTTSISTSQIGINDVVVGTDSILAVGSESIGFAKRAAVWTASTDGTDWQRLDAEAPELGGGGDREAGDRLDMEMTDAEIDGDRLIAVGTAWTDEIRRWPVVWLHDDNGWQRHDLPYQDESGPVLIDLVKTTHGYVALGFDNRMFVWNSPDGIQWTQVVASGLEPGDHVTSAVSANNRILAVGHSGGFDKPSPALWISDDGGSTWLASPPPPIDPDHPVGEILDLDLNSGRMVAIGLRSTAGDISFTQREDGSRLLSDEQLLVVWTTEDGITWEETAVLGGPDELIVNPHLVRGSQGYLIAYSSATVAEDRASAWFLGDDGTLTDIGYPGGAGTEPLRLAFTGSDHLLFTIPEVESARQAVDNGEPQPEVELWRLTTD